MAKHRYIIWAALIAVLLLMHSAGTTRANEPMWPRFRGPNGSGLAAEGQNPPVEFGPEQNLLWKTPVPSGHSSPCIWGDHIFLTGFDKEKKELQVFCIERSSGKIRWSRIVPAEKIEKVHSMSSPAAPTPTSDGKHVYIYFGSYGLLCYDYEGNEKWCKPIPIPSNKYGSDASPTLYDQLLLINCDQKTDSYILAVNLHNGETAWKRDRPMATSGWSTPIIWTHDDVEEVILVGSRRVVAYNLKDGMERWWIGGLPHDEGPVNTPVLGNKTLFVAASYFGGDPDDPAKMPLFDSFIKQYDKNNDMNLSKDEIPPDLVLFPRLGPEWTLTRSFPMFDADENGLINHDEWKGADEWLKARFSGRENMLIAIRPGGEGDATDTHILWKQKRGIPQITSPLFYKSYIYLVKHGGIVSCYNAKSGQLLFMERIKAKGYYYSSPVAAAGKVYMASMLGVVTVIKADDTLNVLASNDLKERIFATPAVVENKLYVRTVKHMYAFGE